MSAVKIYIFGFLFLEFLGNSFAQGPTPSNVNSESAAIGEEERRSVQGIIDCDEHEDPNCAGLRQLERDLDLIEAQRHQEVSQPRPSSLRPARPSASQAFDIPRPIVQQPINALATRPASQTLPSLPQPTPATGAASAQGQVSPDSNSQNGEHFESRGRNQSMTFGESNVSGSLIRPDLWVRGSMRFGSSSCINQYLNPIIDRIRSELPQASDDSETLVISESDRQALVLAYRDAKLCLNPCLRREDAEFLARCARINDMLISPSTLQSLEEFLPAQRGTQNLFDLGGLGPSGNHVPTLQEVDQIRAAAINIPPQLADAVGPEGTWVAEVPACSQQDVEDAIAAGAYIRWEYNATRGVCRREQRRSSIVERQISRSTALTVLLMIDTSGSMDRHVSGILSTLLPNLVGTLRRLPFASNIVVSNMDYHNDIYGRGSPRTFSVQSPSVVADVTNAAQDFFEIQGLEFPVGAAEHYFPASSFENVAFVAITDDALNEFEENGLRERLQTDDVLVMERVRPLRGLGRERVFPIMTDSLIANPMRLWGGPHLRRWTHLAGGVVLPLGDNLEQYAETARNIVNAIRGFSFQISRNRIAILDPQMTTITRVEALGRDLDPTRYRWNAATRTVEIDAAVLPADLTSPIIVHYQANDGSAAGAAEQVESPVDPQRRALSGW